MRSRLTINDRALLLGKSEMTTSPAAPKPKPENLFLNLILNVAVPTAISAKKKADDDPATCDTCTDECPCERDECPVDCPDCDPECACRTESAKAKATKPEPSADAAANDEAALLAIL